MNHYDYGTHRWQIVYGCYAGVEKTAVDRLYGLIQGFVPYILTAFPAQEADTTGSIHQVILGTMDSNPLLRQLADLGFFHPQEKAEGYCIQTGRHPNSPDQQITVLQGADPAGVLYAVSDYERWAINHGEIYHGYHYDRKHRPFIDEALPFNRRSSPSIEHRGFWSWGHVIYDYRNYIEHMSRCKLNTLILWNDYAPLNAKEVIDYAHAHAVKVIWGYSWCWGQPVDPLNPAELEKWTNFVLNTYEQQYAALNVDGIYFQTFTETADTTIGGQSISDLVIHWVNEISSRVYTRYPDLWIQFGIHASSIRAECTKFSAIDSKMSIVWEDAGVFPYAYDPARCDNPEQTLEYTKTLLSLRGEKERFGAVLKGFTVLNWAQFEHQMGPFVLGSGSPLFNRAHAAEKEFYWRYAAPYWISQAPHLQKLLQAVADAPIRDRLITALVEDGMWESSIHSSAALFSELLWDPHANLQDILTAVLHDSNISL